MIVDWCLTTLNIKIHLPTLFHLASCPPVAAPLHDLCDRVDPSLPDEDRGEEVHPAGDLSEVLQDMGEQMEDRAEEETPPGTSPPQVPPKVLTQLSVGDGECGRSLSAVVQTKQVFSVLDGRDQQDLKRLMGNLRNSAD